MDRKVFGTLRMQNIIQKEQFRYPEWKFKNAFFHDHFFMKEIIYEKKYEPLRSRGGGCLPGLSVPTTRKKTFFNVRLP